MKKFMTIYHHQTYLTKQEQNTLQLNDRNRHTNKEINCMEYVIKKIYITLCCTVHHTMKRGITVHNYNSNI